MITGLNTKKIFKEPAQALAHKMLLEIDEITNSKTNPALKPSKWSKRQKQLRKYSEAQLSLLSKFLGYVMLGFVTEARQEFVKVFRKGINAKDFVPKAIFTYVA